MRPTRMPKDEQEIARFKQDWFSKSFVQLKEVYHVKSINSLKKYAAGFGLPPKELTLPRGEERYLTKKYHLNREQLEELKKDILNDFLEWLKDTFNELTPMNFNDFIHKFEEWCDYQKIGLNSNQAQNKRRQEALLDDIFADLNLSQKIFLKKMLKRATEMGLEKKNKPLEEQNPLGVPEVK